nr:probable cytochrome P450 313a1 isoform X2 [Drosophila suzukii]
MLMLRLPGPIGLPLLGSSLENIITYKRKISFRTKYLDKYGSTILTWMGPVPFIVTRDPNVVEDAFNSSDCNNKSPHVNAAITNCMGLGLLGLEDHKWIDRRKHLNPAFKHDVLLSFFHIFDAETNILRNKIESYVEQGEIELVPDMLRWSFRIAAQTTMGSDVKHDEHFKNNALVECFEALICQTTLNILMPLAQNKIISKLCGYEKVQTDNLSRIQKMLDNVVQKKQNATDESKSDPEMNIVINRAMELFRKGDISYTDVKKRVMKETLRLIPAIPITARATKNDVRLSNGVLLPKGVVIGIDIFHTHRNPEVWGPDASKFNPDNFLPKNIEKRHSYAFVPFARGKRNCIGSKYAMMSSKFALCRLLRNYKISTSFRYEDLVYVDNMTMKLAEYPRLEFKRRT